MLAIDANRAACVSFQINHPECRVVVGDLNEGGSRYVLDRLSEIPGADVPVGVVGGPPCQAFSRGNVKKQESDPRRLLPAVYAKALAKLREEYNIDFFVFENVAALRHSAHKPIFGELKRLFRRAGFRIFEDELDAVEFGVPQTRKRVFVVGFNQEKYPDLEFSFPLGSFSTHSTVRDAIGGLPEPVFFKRGLSEAEFGFHPNHWCMMPRSRRFTDGSLKRGSSAGRPFRVLAWDKPSWTVAYGNREVHVHPSAKRRLSVLEAMLLQGFPLSYRLAGNLSEQIRQVSDAVPPALGEALGIAIRDAIYATSCETGSWRGRPHVRAMQPRRG
jgi:DNA (cytosine-5)-methyltransferase 1